MFRSGVLRTSGVCAYVHCLLKAELPELYGARNLRTSTSPTAGPLRSIRRSHIRRASVQTKAAVDQDSTVTKAVVAAGFIANPVVLVSEYFLKTTGEGLPPGPGGVYGATEGVSYLVIVGVVAWSIFTKAKTGSGLPGNLLGAVEGLSYLSLVAGKRVIVSWCMAAHALTAPDRLVLQVLWWLLWSLLRKVLYLASPAKFLYFGTPTFHYMITT